MEVALAAVKLAHEAGGGTDDDEEIPQVAFRPDQGAPGARRRRAPAQVGRAAAGPRRPRGRPGRPAVRRAPAATPASAPATSSARSPARPG